MSPKQRIAVAAAPLVVVTMTPVFSYTGQALGPSWGWYAGFPFYWIIWCIALPVAILGWSGIQVAFGPPRMAFWLWLLVGLPPAVASLGRLVGVTHPHPVLPWLGMALANGTLEEVLWRGTYVVLFPERPFWAVVWPTLWFTAWHFAPGRLSMGEQVWTLVVGAAVFGGCMSVVAYRAKSIRWTALAHVLAGIVQL